jgi:peroxiredoxin
VFCGQSAVGPSEGAPVRRVEAEARPATQTFDLVSLDGARLDLAALRGKAVVLNFWFTSCPPCRAEIPALNRLVEAHRGNGDVAFIGIALDEEDALRDFLADHEFRYTIASDPKGALARLYGVSAYPAHVVIDRRGHMVGQLSGRMDTAHEVLSGLVEPALER